VFSYYGSKSRIINYYPAPLYDTIIEPFAGSARYALKYWYKNIILVDKYDVIIKIWQWLQQASKADIMRLPKLKQGEIISRKMFDSDGEYLLMGFMAAQGSQAPRQKISMFGAEKFDYNKQRIAALVDRIRQWTIIHGDYFCLENRQATWFIDPPYMHGGSTYKEKKINYPFLAQWCSERQGQVIVCENSKADWLPFKPMITVKGMKHITTEAIWSNMSTSYDLEQLVIKF